MILSNQRTIFNKAGLGFNLHKRQKLLKNFFVKSLSNTSSNVSYHYYGRLGHKAYLCNFRKLNDNKIKMIWIPKETITTNPKGPKKVWVSKIIA